MTYHKMFLSLLVNKETHEAQLELGFAWVYVVSGIRAVDNKPSMLPTGLMNYILLPHVLLEFSLYLDECDIASLGGCHYHFFVCHFAVLGS